MVNKVIEAASGKVIEKWGKEAAVECQISTAWFQAELRVAMELMADKLGKSCDHRRALACVPLSKLVLHSYSQSLLK